LEFLRKVLTEEGKIDEQIGLVSKDEEKNNDKGLNQD
jgi:hypothetical protein